MSLLLSSTLANPTTPYFALAGSGGSAFVSGMIMIYYGQTAPTGWAICDGTNGTPDLRDRFVNGAGTSFPYGQPGGAASVTLTLDMIPNHTHLSIPAQAAGVAEGSGGGYAVDGTADSGLITGYNTQLPVSTMPPYLTLTYIMKL